jgi:integrase
MADALMTKTTQDALKEPLCIQEIACSKASGALNEKGDELTQIGALTGPFAKDIERFVACKRSAGRRYVAGERSLRSFDKFCSMQAGHLLSAQQLADAWHKHTSEKNGDVSTVRQFGLYLSVQRSERSFTLPYADGGIPRPAFAGFASLFSGEIGSFLEAKRLSGIKYRIEKYCLRDFDRFCTERPCLALQQLADTFICSQKELGYRRGKRSISVLRAFGNYLTDHAHPSAFSIAERCFVAGPYAKEVATFVAFKRSCGFKYKTARYQLRRFDTFCASSENEGLTSQQLADKWVLKRGDEHPNARVGRVGPIRVFGRYLTSIGHPLAFSIADDVAQGTAAKPPYLFAKEDIDIFFTACAALRPDEKDPFAHIVCPAAFLFMHCMGVRTCELDVLVEDVDFATGEVVIADAKNGDRVIYMSEELSELLGRYNETIEKLLPKRKHLFPASPVRSRNDFAKRFSALWGSCVFSQPLDKKPRFYDLRHHFLYRNVELSMQSGGDVNVLRPYLMRHMGHRLPESFQYYFHLSPPIRKEVARIKEDLDWMMPDIPEVPYE